VELNTEGNFLSGGEAMGQMTKKKKGGGEESAEEGGSDSGAWEWGLGGAVGWGGGMGGLGAEESKRAVRPVSKPRCGWDRILVTTQIK
jgi:hypothetical protein